MKFDMSDYNPMLRKFCDYLDDPDFSHLIDSDFEDCFTVLEMYSFNINDDLPTVFVKNRNFVEGSDNEYELEYKAVHHVEEEKRAFFKEMCKQEFNTRKTILKYKRMGIELTILR
ncbi:MAG TPA: hypothetical protein VJU85_05150 [Nitrososphaeraceae archaeon]|nr:hypothetical protein [Nitrososphaeraceae archaeon]